MTQYEQRKSVRLPAPPGAGTIHRGMRIILASLLVLHTGGAESRTCATRVHELRGHARVAEERVGLAEIVAGVLYGLHLVALRPEEHEERGVSGELPHNIGVGAGDSGELRYHVQRGV